MLSCWITVAPKATATPPLPTAEGLLRTTRSSSATTAAAPEEYSTMRPWRPTSKATALARSTHNLTLAARLL